MWIDLADDLGKLSFIFVSPHDRECSVAGAEDDDADHQAGGEAEGEGVGFYERHFPAPVLEAGSDPRVSGARCVRLSRNHREGKAETAARFAQSDP